MFECFAWLTLLIASGSAISFLANLWGFRKAVPWSGEQAGVGCPHHDDLSSHVSVLIPARNEAERIGATLGAVLANRGIDFEVIVLDDHSQDGTAARVAELATRDERVRLVSGATLPPGWCGKQFACHQLAQHARYDELLFLDADVKLAQDAIVRCCLQRRLAKVDLLSGFPRQQVGSLGEALLIPLMHLVLLTYLPFRLMRHSQLPSASAGCGQLFLTRRQAYEESGGHGAIKGSLHDGVTLPRSYRQGGWRTDVFDAGDLATCRMYRGWLQTWRGLSKNAHEGMANTRLIFPMTGLLVMGYLVPTVLALQQCLLSESAPVFTLAFAAAFISYVPRLVAAARFDRCWLAAMLLPVSIFLFVLLQWVAFLRNAVGYRPQWRGRVYATSTP